MAKVTGFNFTMKVLEVHRSTLQPHYNASHYNVVSIISQLCHGSQIDYFAICM